MEKLLFLYVHLPVFLLQLYPVLILSEPYVFPDKYFINCGSDSSVTLDSRKFVGDESANSSSLGNSKPVTNTSQPADTPLYQTARFHWHPFRYDLDITDQGLYVVRLHFFPFMSNEANLADAFFHVSASNKSLVSNLSFRNSSSFPVIKEFLVPISSAKFRINFIPATQTSFAFVNAIEVFFLVPSLKDNRTHVTSLGSKGAYQGLPSQVLRTVHRVIVGGQSFIDSTAVAPEWVADDDYIFIENYSAKTFTYGRNVRPPNYDDRMDNENYNVSSQNFIPDLVYRTCREVTLKNGQSSNSTNITWHFNVPRNGRHLVRVHFCDIISDVPNTVNFSLFISCKIDNFQ